MFSVEENGNVIQPYKNNDHCLVRKRRRTSPKSGEDLPELRPDDIHLQQPSNFAGASFSCRPFDVAFKPT